jgi:HSP20 family protein
MDLLNIGNLEKQLHHRNVRRMFAERRGMADVKIATAPDTRFMRAGRYMPEHTPMMPSVADAWGANPFTVIKEVAVELEKRFSGSRPADAEAWSPTIECQRGIGALIVRVDLPGMKPADVKVEITVDGLILEGERKREQVVKRERTYRCERSFGRFYRFIPLPEGAKTEEASAELSDGVLTVTVPLPEVREQRRAVPVRPGK